MKDFEDFEVHASGGGIPGGGWESSFSFRLRKKSIEVDFISIGTDTYTQRWSLPLKGGPAWREALEFATTVDSMYFFPLEVLEGRGSLRLYGSAGWRSEAIALALLTEDDSGLSFYGSDLLSMTEAQGNGLARELGNFLEADNTRPTFRAGFGRWQSLKAEDSSDFMMIYDDWTLGKLLMEYGYGTSASTFVEVLDRAEAKYEAAVEELYASDPARELEVLGYVIDDVVERVVRKPQSFVEAMSGRAAYEERWVRGYLKGLIRAGERIPMEVAEVPSVGEIDFRVLAEAVR